VPCLAVRVMFVTCRLVRQLPIGSSVRQFGLSPIGLTVVERREVLATIARVPTMLLSYY